METTSTPREAAKRELKAGLRAACDELGWTPLQLAVESGVSHNSAVGWLTGDTAPSGEIVLLLLRRSMVVRAHLLGA